MISNSVLIVNVQKLLPLFSSRSDILRINLFERKSLINKPFSVKVIFVRIKVFVEIIWLNSCAAWVFFFIKYILRHSHKCHFCLFTFLGSHSRNQLHIDLRVVNVFLDNSQVILVKPVSNPDPVPLFRSNQF
jgi:hypothetical protein